MADSGALIVGIVGSRRRDSQEDYIKVKDVLIVTLVKYGVSAVRLVSGGCPRGADRFAEMIAKGLGLPITIYYPDWKRYGRAAGFARNTEIARNAQVLIACVAPDREGGTEDTIKKFKRFHPDCDQQLIIVG